MMEKIIKDTKIKQSFVLEYFKILNWVKVEYSLSKMPWIVGYLYMHNELSWEWDPNLRKKFIHFSHIPYTDSLNITLCNFYTAVL